MKQYLLDMLGGPGTLRFFLQPALAIVIGALHGLGDREARRPPFLVDVARARGRRLRLVAEALRRIGVPLAIAVVASMVFQYLIRGQVRLVLALGYALLFVALPYLGTRGLTNRLAG